MHYSIKQTVCQNIKIKMHANYARCIVFLYFILAYCAVLGTCLNAFFVLGSPALQKSPSKVPQQGTDANTLAHLGGVANNPVLICS